MEEKLREKFITVISLFLGGCLFSTNGLAQIDSKNLVRGFAQYQAGRIENLVLDNFISDLADEELLVRFFPQTSASISNYEYVSGKRLLPIISHFVQKDLNEIRSATKCLGQQLKFDQKSGSREQVLQIQQVVNLLAHFSKKPNLRVADLSGSLNCQVDGDSVKSGPIKLPDDVVDLFKKANEKLDDTQLKASAVKTVQSQLQATINDLKDGAASETQAEVLNILGQLSDRRLIENVSLIQSLADGPLNGEGQQNADDPKNSYTIYIHQFIQLLSSINLDVDGDKFENFKSSGLFLAALADASNTGQDGADSVAAVIAQFVDEDVVYASKRNPVAYFTNKPDDEPNLVCRSVVLCKNTWFIGSYFGAAVDLNDDIDSDNRLRAYGPVGIEFKVYSGSVFSVDSTVTIMYAPVDLGLYITSELKGDDYEADVEDIDAPSLVVSVSSKKSPFSYQFGYQEDVLLAGNIKDDVYFISATFDLPVWRIW